MAMTTNGLVGEAQELEYYRAFGQRMHTAFVVLSADMRITWASPSFEALLGYALDDLGDLTIGELVHPEDLTVIVPVVMQVLGAPAENLARPAAARNVEFDVRVMSAAGDWVPVSLSGRVLDGDGRLICTLRPAADQHAFHAVVDRLGSAAPLDEVLASVLGLIRAQFLVDRASVIHDSDGHTAVVGDPVDLTDAVEALGCLRSDVVLSAGIRHDDERWLLPILSPSRERLYGAFWIPPARVGEPGPYDGLVAKRTCHLASLAFAGAETTRSLLRAATLDHLTGVASRREFELQLERIVPRGDLPVALLFVDLDDFKSVNDTLGHHHGDRVLVEVAARLQRAVGPDDTVARLGGDEFAILFRSMPAPQVATQVERIAALFAEPIALEAGVEVVASASVGVGLAQHPNQLDGLLRRADIDMYRTKRGR
jgi:diguanylate cyclase (GGDEF)-like protein/PAS domain S-box-containing protein